MKKLFLAVLAAFVAFASPAFAQETTPPPSLEIAGGGTAFTDALGLVEVAPNLFLMPEEVQDLRLNGCAGGPQSLYSDRATKMVWCSRASNGELGRYLKSGAKAWFLLRTPAGLQLEIYMKGVNRDPNVRCWGLVGFRGFAQIHMTCIDTANGTMFWQGVLGALIGNGGSMAMGAAVANLTAPAAGDYIVTSGSGSRSTSGSEATGGGGAAPPINIYNSPSATAGANIQFNAACPTGNCH